jgi:hypothetical protein
MTSCKNSWLLKKDSAPWSKASENLGSYNGHDWWKFWPFYRANVLGSVSFVNPLVSGNSHIIIACSELTWTNTIIDWTCRKRVCNTRTNRCRQGCWLPAGGSFGWKRVRTDIELLSVKRVVFVKVGRFEGANGATIPVLKTSKTFAGQKESQRFWKCTMNNGVSLSTVMRLESERGLRVCSHVHVATARNVSGSQLPNAGCCW